MTRPVLIVTGGSRGIGASVARLAAERGWDVALTYVSDAAAAERVAETCRAAGARAEAIRSDTGSEADIGELFRGVDARFGRLDALVANAGITGLISPLPEAEPETIRRVIDVNVTGTILTAREAVRRMSTRLGGRGGAIVLVSSVASRLGSAGEYVWYAASKGAVDSFTQGLAREVAREGIRVNAVAPGLTETDIHASGGKPERLARLTPMIPMGRPGQPDEIAETILFLLTDAASYVTGAILTASGGR